jgi:phosphoglycerate kinase
MANTFLAAQGHDVGGSRTEPDLFRDALDVMRGAPGLGCDILLPRDFVIADRFAADAERRIATLGDEIPDGWLLLDIGPATVAAYREVIGRAGTVFWNGPMGVFELEPFARGTADTAHAVAASRAFRVVGGGDSVAAVRRLGITGQFDHVSTGGGASLEFIEGRDLPGLSVIPDASPVEAATD